MAVVVPILSTFNAAGINAATGALGALGNSLKRVGLQAAAAAVGVKAMGAAIDFVSESVTSARDLQRNLFALNTVFGDLAPKMTQFTKDAAGMGISQVDAARTATYLGSVLKQAGFSMADTSTETMKLTTLAQDLATTYGYDVSEALTAMTALFRGEYDPIEKFGVALKQNEINSLLAAKQMGNLTGQALLNAQQQVRLEQLYKRTADAQGSFAAQSGTLYGVQSRLNASFENMKTTLGQQLLPVLTKFTTALIPVVNASAPKLSLAFTGLGKIMQALLPLVAPVVRIITDLIGAIGNLMTALAPLVEFMSSSLAVTLDYIADKLESLGRGIDQITGFFSDLGEIVNGQFGSGATQFLDDVFKKLAAANPLLQLAYDIWKRFTGAIDNRNAERSQSAYGDRLTAAALAWQKSNPTTTTTSGAAKNQGTNFVKDFFAGMAEENAKQVARLKLSSMGASTDLIESIVGSGEGWKKVYANIISGGQTVVTRVQALFSTTKAGIAEVQKAVEESAAAYKSLVEDQMKVYQEQKDAYDASMAAIDAFKTEIQGLVATAKPLAFVEREVGRLESAVVDSFGNMKASIQDAIGKTLTEEAAANLQAYADKESVIFAQLAKQRDALKAKYDLADALIKETRSAVVAYANITSVLDKQTTTVTETIQTMVDGVRLTRTSTREQITEGGNLVDSFKAILEKTVAFGKNLKQLRALGLDKNLYKQIVDAGLEAGGATAAAIIEGGAGTVSELNSLFGQLDAVGADIAETSATVMFNNGVEIVGGLLEGLKSQDAMLVAAAESMATSFANAFNAMLSASIQMPKLPATPGFATNATDPAGSYFLNSIAGLEGAALDKQIAMLTGQDVSAPGSFMNTMGYQSASGPVTNYTVNVNAGTITDQASLPQVIVDALGTYTKQAGAGGLTRILGL